MKNVIKTIRETKQTNALYYDGTVAESYEKPEVLQQILDAKS